MIKYIFTGDTMKNRYEIVEVGTVIDLEDEFGNIHSITVSKNQLLYTLMDFIKRLEDYY